MRIAIVGNGNMGTALGELSKQAGHAVRFGSRQPDLPVARAIDGAELVIFAVPYESALVLAEQPELRAALSGKIVVDVSNPLTPDFMSLTVGHTSSAAEEIARRLPGARVVKAFNTLFADVLRERVRGATVVASVLVASDDDVAKQQVMALASAFGLSAVDSGPLANARYLELALELLIQLAYGKGLGTKIGLSLVHS